MRSRKQTQKDNADSGVQFITLTGPRQNLLLAKDPNRFCENLIYMQVMKQKLELDMEQQTGSKKEKEYIKAIYCHLLI